MKKLWMMTPLVLIVLTACGMLGVTPAGEVPIVQAPVVTPTTAAPPADTQAAPVGNATIGGLLGYPSEVIPPMNVYAVKLGGTDFYKTTTAENQSSYSLQVPPGDYQLLAYPVDFADVSGGYTPASSCNLPASDFQGPQCEDHTLLTVTVAAGQTFSEAHITDWYAPPGTFPPSPEAGGSPPPGGQGTITGQVNFPSEGHPAMQIYALRTDGQAFQFADVGQNAGTYAIPVDAGDYWVVAYADVGGNELQGAYTSYSVCFASAADPATCDANDHTLTAVNVQAGQVVSGVNVSDWYAPPGTFPARP